MSKTLFQKYGGFAVVSRVVLAFYDKALDSDQVGEFFDDIDMKELVDHQTKFISSLLGGPVSFTDAHLRSVHASLGISNSDMDEMAGLLAETLDEFGFEPGDRDAVIGEFEARRGLIVDPKLG